MRYLFANRFLRVIFFLILCPLEVQLLVRCTILLTAHETWWYNLSFSLYDPVECLVEHQLPYQGWWYFLAFGSSLTDGQRGWEGELAADMLSPEGPCCRGGWWTMAEQGCRRSLMRLSRCIAGSRADWGDWKAFWFLCCVMLCQRQSTCPSRCHLQSLTHMAGTAWAGDYEASGVRGEESQPVCVKVVDEIMAPFESLKFLLLPEVKCLIFLW